MKGTVHFHREDLEPIGRSDKEADLCIKKNIFLKKISKKAVQEE